MGKGSWLKTHPVFAAAVAVLALGLFWVGYFLASFDLNNYRVHFQQTLEERLATPVRLGEAQLKLRNAGIAISFVDVSLGDKASALALTTQDLWLLFEWSALFHRELRFSKIGLLSPTIRFNLPAASYETPGRNGLISLLAGARSILDGLSVRSLELRDGRIQVLHPHPGEISREILLENIELHLHNLSLGQTASIALTASLDQGTLPAALNLTGDVALPERLAELEQTRVALNLDIARLSGAWLTDTWPFPEHNLVLNGYASIENRVTGTLSEGLSLSSRLASDDLNLEIPDILPAYPLRHVQIAGHLIQDGRDYQLNEAIIHLDDLRLAGNLFLQATDKQQHLRIHLSQGSMPIAMLQNFEPRQKKNILRPLTRGKVLLEEGSLQFVLTTPDASGWALEQSAFTGTVRDLAWQVSPTTAATVDSIEFSSDGPRWTLRNGVGKVGPTSLTLEGQLNLSTLADPELALNLSGVLDSSRVSQEFQFSSLADLNVSGVLPFQAKLTGPHQQLDLDLKLNLEQLALRHTTDINIAPRPKRFLQLHGILSGKHLEIDHAHLQFQPISGRVAGQLDWTGQPTLALQGLLEMTDANQLASVMPHWHKLGLSGAANLDFTLQGPLRKPESRATLTLQNLGISMRGAMADINNLQGRIHLSPTGFASEELLARIGDSPVTLSARYAAQPDPHWVLDIRANRVRADELIFYSDQVYVHDLAGRLEIRPEQLSFTPVQVRLPGGTQAHVTGTVTFKPQVNVSLDITSEFARIEEVIGLWSSLSTEARDLRQAKREARRAARKPYRVTITAKAERGDLYGMHFQEAVGTIIKTPGQLLIHPLDFRVDKGNCVAQVLVDDRQDKPSLMRISGHAENIDAYRIYNELLRQKSVVRGSLSGDFYLQGELGENYLPSTFGSFDIEVNKGVLRKFHVLSKVFSLLNVSQLFALKLPDMDIEGMPFDKISGSLLMQNGVLSSEKLLVKSEAMNQSYVGTFDMVNQQVDFTLAVQPLRTVDKILSRIPIAGWLLTGEEKALITTHFSVKGPRSKPEVSVQPVTSLSKKTLGLIRRTLNLPVKLVTDPSVLFGEGESE